MMNDLERNKKSAPSSRERRLSLFLLAVLAIIAIIMLVLQNRFDPGAWREQAPATDRSGRPQAVAGVDSDQAEGLVPLAPAERYDADRLSDKIDGKADLYLSAGFRGLKTRRFALAGDQARWMERYVYDMADLRNAFSVFSAQRRQNIQHLDLTAYAYLAGNGLFFVHGPYYVEIIASETSSQMQTAMQTLGSAFVHAHGVSSARLTEIDRFPEMHRLADSVQLATRDAFGIQGLDGIFTAAYASDASRATAFISRRAAPEEARMMAEKFDAFWIGFSGEQTSAPDDLQDARIVLILDNYEIVMTWENWLFGVHEATSLEYGLALVKQLRQQLVGRGR